MEPVQMACSVQAESSSASHTSDSTPKVEYDVFLSFAGKDTRLKFTGHLYEAFTSSGIKTYRDDVDLPNGEDIKKGLFQAIKHSLCAVLVMSENYAESSWCLEELEEILECQKRWGLRVFPIFYNVNPGDVKHLRGSFGKALAKHEDKFKENAEKVQNWRNVLSQIGSISGEDTRGMHEADLIKKIVGDIWNYLSSKLPCYYDNLVGIDSRVAEMMPILEIEVNDTCFVGIWGMGGLGKTTLARVVFKKISDEFDIHCFLTNVKDTLKSEGLVTLQKRLLSHLKVKEMDNISDHFDGMEKIRYHLRNKKVILVLDDVDDISQLDYLAKSPEWFGEGSRTIITTRDKQLLIACGVDVKRIYEMKAMEEHESLKLFSNKAFHKDHPEGNYLELSKSVVKYAGGLPLALEVLGPVFCGKTIDEWIDTLNRLKQIPDDDRTLQTLRISYDGLKNDNNKAIFLDIACFFKGWQKEEVNKILESCGLCPKDGINDLIQKALLVETEDQRLEMHDLLEELGRYMVHQESPNDVGKRSRLWKFEDIKKVLENNMGSETIQAIVTQYDIWNQPDKINVHREAFSKMSNLRLLLVRGLINGPLLIFPEFMTNLAFIDLSNSEDVVKTPDFSGVPYLKYLCLRGCKSLVTVHPSLGQLKELVEVNLNGCGNLQFLPEKLEANSLIRLDLGRCIKVAALPEFGEGMKKLSYLNVKGTAITKLPESLRYLIGLKRLNLSGLKILNFHKVVKAHINRPISSLNVMPLTELYLRKCGLKDKSVPDDFGSLSSLIVLDLSDNDFVNLPTDCFSSLLRLLFLSLNHCKRLKSLPRLPPKLIRLDASNCRSMKPLSDRQLCDLVASLDHKYRGRSKYVISYEEHEETDDYGDITLMYDYDDITSMYKHVKPECLPLSDFFAIIPASKIPSWFTNKEYYCDSDTCRSYEIKANIPSDLRDRSEWSGIVVCFLLSSADSDLVINWRTKAAEDDDYTLKEWGHLKRGYEESTDMCIMVLELNEETCWKHLRSHNNSLHIQLSVFVWCEVLECGWRVICKEDIQEWCSFIDFTKLQPAYPHELNLPSTVLDRFIVKDLRDIDEDIDEEGWEI